MTENPDTSGEAHLGRRRADAPERLPVITGGRFSIGVEWAGHGSTRSTVDALSWKDVLQRFLLQNIPEFSAIGEELAFTIFDKEGVPIAEGNFTLHRMRPTLRTFGKLST